MFSYITVPHRLLPELRLFIVMNSVHSLITDEYKELTKEKTKTDHIVFCAEKTMERTPGICIGMTYIHSWLRDLATRTSLLELMGENFENNDSVP